MNLSSFRNQLGGWIETNMILVALEIAVVAAVPLALTLVGLPRSILPLLFMGWASLRLRGKSWKDVGLRRPSSWPAILTIGTALAVTGGLAGERFVSPLLFRLTGEPRPRGAELSALPGNVLYLMFLLVAIWLLGAIGEELVYRGYVLNRLLDFFGSGRIGWGAGLILASLMFSVGHGIANRTALIGDFIVGMIEGTLYVVARRNLWLPIVFHGVWDTMFLVSSFLDLSLR